MYHASMRKSDFHYELPEELIAQQAVERGESSLLVLNRLTGEILHRKFRSILEWIEPGDLLLLNDTEVIPARMYARRPTGRRFEIFMLREIHGRSWEALLRPSSRAHCGESLELEDGGRVRLGKSLGDGIWELEFSEAMNLDRMKQLGEAPLPPYIRRPEGATEADLRRYQTVYASQPGAVAAPTAGLHFNQELIEEIRNAGAEIQRVTLHVGIGTFRPVAVDEITEHEMHEERYGFSEESAAALNAAMSEGRRIVCVGTTSVRALEDAIQKGEGRVKPGWTSTRIFIYPGFEFRGTGALLTNFHLPESTLLMLVSAFVGREKVLESYQEAVRRRYRFFSYGDAMLIV